MGRVNRSIQLIGLMLAALGTQAMAGAQTPAKPAPAHADLEVDFTAPVGFGAPESSLYLLVEAAGSPPEPAVLRDSSGLNVASVTSVAGARCEGLRRRVTGIRSSSTAPDRLWCLRLRGLRPGSKVTGNLEGAGAEVGLKVAIRHHFVWGPLSVTILGWLIAGLAVLLANHLRRYINRELLGALIGRNATGVRENRISGLQEWAEGRLKAGMRPVAVLPMVQRIIDDGPTAERLARANLRATLDASGLPEDLAIAAEACAEAARTDHIMGELADPSGALSRELPADKLDKTVRDAADLRAQLEEISALLQQMPPASRDGFGLRLARLQEEFQRAGSDQIDDLIQRAATLSEDMHRAEKPEAAAFNVGAQPAPTQPVPHYPAPTAAAQPPAAPARKGLRRVALVAGLLLTLAVAASLFLGQAARSPAPKAPHASPPPPAETPTVYGDVAEPAPGPDAGAPPPPPGGVQSRPSPRTGSRTIAGGQSRSFPWVLALFAVALLLALVLLLRYVARWIRNYLTALLLTAAGIFLVGSLGVVTVAVSTYAPNATFGTKGDYLGLLSSSLGSGALSGILGVLAYWKATSKLE